MILNRGDVVLVNFGSQVGSVQSGARPAVICQNNVGNAYSSTTIVAPLTSRMNKAKLPTHVYLAAGDGGIRVESTILTEQIQTIDKQQIKKQNRNFVCKVAFDVKRRDHGVSCSVNPGIAGTTYSTNK